MTTFDTDVFGAAGGGGMGVVKYRPGLMVEYGDEVKSLKDLESLTTAEYETTTQEQATTQSTSYSHGQYGLITPN